MSKVYREITNLRTGIFSITTAVVGVLLMMISRHSYFQQYPEAQSLLRDFGSLFTASVAVALIWELFSKRAFMSELLTATRLADEIQESGLVRISNKWHGEVNWVDLLRKNDEFEIFFMYGRTWRNINRAEILNFARRKNTKATIILPDIEDQELISQIAKSIETTANDLNERILEAVKEFSSIFESVPDGNSKLMIKYVSVFPVYSYYRFGNMVIVTFYSLDRTKKDVPTLMFEKGGKLFDFFSGDFASLRDGNSSRTIYPAQGVA